MARVTRFPDVLELLRVWLTGRVGIPYGVRLPDPWPPGGFVELRRTGGGRDHLSEEVRVSVAAWHPSRPAEAERLAGVTVSEVVALAGGDLDGWQVLDTGNPGGVAAQPDPRFPEVHRAIAMVRLRVRGVSEEREGGTKWV